MAGPTCSPGLRAGRATSSRLHSAVSGWIPQATGCPSAQDSPSVWTEAGSECPATWECPEPGPDSGPGGPGAVPRRAAGPPLPAKATHRGWRSPPRWGLPGPSPAAPNTAVPEGDWRVSVCQVWPEPGSLSWGFVRLWHQRPTLWGPPSRSVTDLRTHRSGQPTRVTRASGGGARRHAAGARVPRMDGGDPFALRRAWGGVVASVLHVSGQKGGGRRRRRKESQR